MQRFSLISLIVSLIVAFNACDAYAKKLMPKKTDPVIIIAAAKGDIKTLKKLVEQGADIETKDSFERTPLLWAAMSGEFEAVKYLVSNGANIHAKDKINENTLHAAARGGTGEIAEYLIMKGLFADEDDTQGKTPLHCAAVMGNYEVAKVLIDHGANVNALDRFLGVMPLHDTALLGRPHTMKLLLSKGADVNAVIGFGDTVLGVACSSGCKECVELLLAYGAVFEYVKEGNVAILHKAAAGGLTGICALLLSKGADIDAKDSSGETPLFWAISRWAEDTAKFLIKGSKYPY